MFFSVRTRTSSCRSVAHLALSEVVLADSDARMAMAAMSWHQKQPEIAEALHGLRPRVEAPTERVGISRSLIEKCGKKFVEQILGNHGKSCENHGKSWENLGRIWEIPWENHGTVSDFFLVFSSEHLVKDFFIKKGSGGLVNLSFSLKTFMGKMRGT